MFLLHRVRLRRRRRRFLSAQHPAPHPAFTICLRVVSVRRPPNTCVMTIGAASFCDEQGRLPRVGFDPVPPSLQQPFARETTPANIQLSGRRISAGAITKPQGGQHEIQNIDVLHRNNRIRRAGHASLDGSARQPITTHSDSPQRGGGMDRQQPNGSVPSNTSPSSSRERPKIG